MHTLTLLFFLSIPIFCHSSIVKTRKYKTSSHPQCLWHNNSCVDKCPEWMIEFRSNCSQSFWKALRTCDHPEVTYVGTVCNFARCDCPNQMVLDTDTGFCYDLDNCPTKHVL